MRIPFCLMALPCALLLYGQADTSFIWSSPCSFPDPRSWDLNGDSIMDVSSYGHVIGTDDEPSSSGHCTWAVLCLAGTTILHDNDPHGPRDPRGFIKEKVLAADELVIGIRTQKLAWANGMIPVVHWGYGSAGGVPPVVTERIGEKIFVLRTEREGAAWLTSFRIQMDPLTHAIDILPVAVVQEGASLPLR